MQDDKLSIEKRERERERKKKKSTFLYTCLWEELELS